MARDYVSVEARESRQNRRAGSAIASVRNYIAQQEEHHRVKSFREELVEFLQRSGVDFDARYLD